MGAIAGGIALSANLALLLIKNPGEPLFSLASNPIVALSLITASCAMILLGQMAKATFDAAAAAHLAAAENPEESDN